MDDPFDLPPDVLRRIPLFAELSKVLSWSGGPVNWDLARQMAASIAAEGAPVGVAAAQEIADHVRVAEMWLADVASLPAPSHLVGARAVTAPDWAEHATTAFAELIDPIAAKTQRTLAEGTGEAENAIAAAVAQLAPMFMGIQAGTIIGTLAGEVTGTHDVGLPPQDDTLLIVTPAIDELAAGNGLDVRAVRQWVALRAAAHRMIYEGFPLVRAQFFASYHDYVSSLDVDIAEGLERLRSLDMSDPSRLQEMLGDQSLFTPQPSPGTAKAAARVTTLLALVEAHSQTAADHAGARAGDTARITEAFARRAASKTRGADMLHSLIGLDPAEGRHTARAFVAGALAHGDWSTLTRMWDEPDGFPTDEEMPDPASWVARVSR